MPRRISLHFPLHLLILFLGLAQAPTLRACPVYLFGDEVFSEKTPRRGEIRLFSKREESGGSWIEMPLQIDPIDEAGRFDFSNESGILSGGLSDADRLSFYPEAFGARMEPSKFSKSSDPFPCKAKAAYEVHRPGEGYAYLLHCEAQTANDPALLRKPEVVYDQRKDQLVSKRYVYEFDPKNHMLFDSIFHLEPSSTAATTVASAAATEVARDSDLLIKADLKYFFTMIFDRDDILSNLGQHRIGNNAAVGALSFYLQILFFKIKLELTTDVSFFRDAIHIPMYVHLPPGASDRQNPGSGMIYSWRHVLPDAQIASAAWTLDLPQGRLGERPRVDEVLKRYCGPFECRFAVSQNARIGKDSSNRLKMVFVLSRAIVRAGFFPMWLGKVQKADYEDFQMPSQEPEYFEDRVGVYFETAGLKEGNHGWDFWLVLDDQKEACPLKVKVDRLDLRKLGLRP